MNTENTAELQLIPARPTTKIVAPEYQWDLSRVSIAIEEITPDQALAYLKGNVRNRGINQKHLDKLLGIFGRGNWRFNGHPISFDWNGALVDGQHRLWMIAHSEQTVPMLVVRGVDPGALSSYDMGKRRTLKDILMVIIGDDKGDGESFTTLSGMVGFATAYRNTKTFRPGVCPEDQRLDLYDEDPDQIRNYAKLYKGGNQLRITAGLLAACHYLFAEKSKDQADKFMAQILLGESLTSEDPAYRYREWIDRKMGLKRTSKSVNIAGLTLVKCWNHLRAGDKLAGPIKPPSIPLDIN